MEAFPLINVMGPTNILSRRGRRDPNPWLQFLEQPGVKPLVSLHCDNIDILSDRLSKSFPLPSRQIPSISYFLDTIKNINWIPKNEQNFRRDIGI
ncbi:hypothetical protein DdX_18298 [Ditylenchus destructor]|uniref:Uncharacterized protein n=1 Tax=Ditylenchus destructor TaxID=166010 RepID=A0AAD4MLG7_9BILA|nr:hypothetical protein DdX_18298 [Ditylenchus destructor]